ncbi:ABC transporter substrate-binding protein [Helicobacter mesocricetorum]|uniref:ABC transporter substrate-binding protein n=1 Tax=Helicobacter mesocricetorum TaxID=87012 RepID=UPI000CF13B6E|nr:ABC transporter substrate-binding protein [Helicobacter mesocricetorum]
MLKIIVLLCGVFLSFTLATQSHKVAVIGLWPLPSLLAFWSDAKLVYIPKTSYNVMQNSINEKYFPQYKEARIGNNENLEELLAMDVDIYICGFANLKICGGLKNAGVKVIELSTNIENHNSKKTLEHWLVELQPYFSIYEKNQKLLHSITQIEEFIEKKTKNLKKPKVLIIHRFEKDNISTGYFSDYLIGFSGGENPLGYRDLKSIGVEEIYNLNPDVIYISNFTPLSPQEFMKKKEYKSLEAVRQNRVYKLPLATYRPFAPSLELGPVLLFLAKHNHPEVFKDLDMRKIFKDYFYEFYEIALEEKELDLILNPNVKTGIHY